MQTRSTNTTHQHTTQQHTQQHRVPAGIGPNTTITNTIVDKNCRVGANCQLINKDGVHEMDRPEEGLYIRDGILIVTKGTEVPNGTVI